MRFLIVLAALLFVPVLAGCASGDAREESRGKSAGGWRRLPLIKGGKVDSAWKHTGYGTFVVDGDAVRTECDERGLGLLVYTKETFGDCQLRVVYRAKDQRSNSGVYVRID